MAPPASKFRRTTSLENRQLLIKNELDLFASRLTQSTIQSQKWSDIRPISSVNEQNPITFQIPGHDDDFLDPIFYLKVNLRIKSGDRSPLPADSLVAPVNCFGHALFRRIDLKLQDTLVSSSTDNYAYRGYIEKLLNFGDGAKKTQLGAELFYKDSAGRFDELDKTNEGYKARKNIVKQSRNCNLFVRIASDIANQPKLIPNLVDVSVTLHQNTNAFRLMYSAQSESPVIEFQDI